MPKEERVMIGADVSEHVGEENRGDKEVMDRYGVKERYAEGQDGNGSGD